MKNRGGYTLFEILCVTSIIVTVISMAGAVSVSGIQRTRQVVMRGHENQLVSSVLKFWQSSMACSDSSTWSVNDGKFVAGTLEFAVDGDHLIVRSGGSLRSAVLPAGSRVTFDIERNGDAADCALLVVEWKSKLSKRSRLNRIRFVACGKGRQL